MALINREGVLITGCSHYRVFSLQGGLITGCSRYRVVSLQGGLIIGWSHQTGLRQISLLQYSQNVCNDSYGPAVHSLAIRFPPEHLWSHIAWGPTGCPHLVVPICLGCLRESKVTDHDLGVIC